MAEGIAITERAGVALASLIARRGRLGELREAVRARFAADLPLTPRVAEGDSAAFIWAGPERWLVASPALPPDDLVASLRESGTASVCDQSDGRVLLRVADSRARDVLARGFPIDLHPSVFKVGDTAITIAAHVTCQIWRTDDVYDIAVPSSFAASFRRWLDGAAAAFGPPPTFALTSERLKG